MNVSQWLYTNARTGQRRLKHTHVVVHPVSSTTVLIPIASRVAVIAVLIDSAVAVAVRVRVQLIGHL